MARPGEFPNVLLVTVDCLRRDRLSAYGYERQTTPFLDSLIPDALHATSAHAAAPWTAPSVVSLLTGRYPYSHGAGIVPGDLKELSRTSLPSALAREVPILPDLLEGYASAAFTAVWNAALPLEGRFTRSALLEKRAPAVIAEASAWIDAHDSPWFCWVHLGDIHDPLDVPKGLRQAFGPVHYRTARRWAFTGARDDVSTEAFRAYREERMRLYDGAVRASDDAIRSLWDRLGEARQHTLLVVTSDHGEELWEHRDEEIADFVDPRGVVGVGHGHNLFQVHLLVPLLIVGPGIEPREISANASLVDVMPTLLRSMGRDIPGHLDGYPLTELPAERAVLAQGIAYGREKAAVILGDRKLLVSPGDGYERTFALGEDRAEAGFIEEVEITEHLRSLLPPEPAAGVPVRIEAEMEDHLRGLGYIE